MATVTGFTAAKMQTVIDDTVVGAHIDGSGHLILEKYDTTTIDAGYMLASVPAASDTVSGTVELATSAETITGTDAVRAVTPAGLAAKVASDTAQGIVELATTTEATTGTDTVRAVTPAGLKAAINALLQLIFPVGSIYTSTTVSTNPATLLGFGTWTAITGRFIIGADGTHTANTTGGSATKSLSAAEVGTHAHGVGSLTEGSAGSHVHEIGVDNSPSGSGLFTINVPGSSGGDAGSIEGTFPAGGHTHTLSGSTANAGSGTAFSLESPWHAAYLWRRTA